MEHIDFSTLTEIWLYGNISYKNWQSILDDLKNIINTFQGYKKLVHKSDYEQIYITKTLDRIQELISSNPIFKKLFNYEYVKINVSNNNLSVLNQELSKRQQAGVADAEPVYSQPQL